MPCVRRGWNDLNMMNLLKLFSQTTKESKRRIKVLNASYIDNIASNSFLTIIVAIAEHRLEGRPRNGAYGEV